MHNLENAVFAVRYLYVPDDYGDYNIRYFDDRDDAIDFLDELKMDESVLWCELRVL